MNKKTKKQIDSQNCQRCGEPDIYCQCRPVSASDHTPTPWKLGDGIGIILGADGVSVALTDAWNVGTCRPLGEKRANAELIFAAVNSHKDFIKRFQYIIDLIKQYAVMKNSPDRAPHTATFAEIFSTCAQAIAKAEGGK